MNPERFKELLDELDGNSLQTLKEKNSRYAQNGDCLHNFRSGAEIAGGTPAQACWGYVTKHLVALRDMVEKDNFSNREDFLEKCQDTINYIRFLWCIGNDGVAMHMPEPEVERDDLYKLLKPMCQYADFNYKGERVCLGTKEKDLCPGYDKCDSYKPKTNNEKEND
jgi:hypothetical protein